MHINTLVSSIYTNTFILPLLNHCFAGHLQQIISFWPGSLRRTYFAMPDMSLCIQSRTILHKTCLPVATKCWKSISPPSRRWSSALYRLRLGMLISGSTALQFLDRTTFLESDLDIYVEHQLRRKIALWLVAIGYKYQPTPKYPRPERELFDEHYLLQFSSDPFEIDRRPAIFKSSADQLSGSYYGPFSHLRLCKSSSRAQSPVGHYTRGAVACGCWHFTLVRMFSSNS